MTVPLEAISDPTRHFTSAEVLNEERAKDIFRLFPWADVIIMPNGIIWRNNPGLIVES